MLSNTRFRKNLNGYLIPVYSIMDLSTGFALLNLLSLNVQLQPSSGEMEMRYEADRKLRNDIFRRYDGRMPPRKVDALQVIPMMSIDHIRSIKEDKGVMTVSATFVFTWMDERLMWNPSNYSGVSSLSATKYELYAFNLWLPTLNLADMPGAGKQQDLFGNHDVDIVITSSGTVKTTVKVLVTAPCYFSFGEYPNDYQNCSITLMSPYYADTFRFAQWGGVEFARLLMNGRVTDAEDFQLIGIDSSSYYMYLGVDIVKDVVKYGPQYCRAFFRYNLMLKRVNHLVFAQLSTPMIMISVFIATSSILPNNQALTVLIFTMGIEVIFSLTVENVLPNDFNATPTIGKLAVFLFFETMFLIFWKVFSIVSRNRLRKALADEPKDPQNLKYLKAVIWTDLGLIGFLFLQAVLVFHIVLKN